MYIGINAKDYNKHNIMLSNKTPNNIMENGDFYRIYYSDKFHNSNGIYIYFTLKNVNFCKYFNKLKCTFKNYENKHIIKLFIDIEKEILKLYSHNDEQSKAIYRVAEQFENGFIKIFPETSIFSVRETSSNFLLKISGIWSNNQKYGLTFRFYIASRLL